ncbi:helix-turn-helix domain-containing protein [Microbacterium hydrocarbonoxydans]|uniref:helix-turn-helix domain-containing protein n=1 Tax=Microbacterium hydrocarbonoxydans TaxID=273678 RepID=UPI002040CB29|nr:helix-turn-helix domain-containing protein [Microbacterium hydrocarbonoxydans]MCM3779876.1 helix-turn-helix domain-containing protein [Microbacterium hydrocarbonoxydans]
MSITATQAVAISLLTVDEVAERLRRTPTSVRHLIASEQLKSGRVGGRRMVRESDLNEFINAAFTEAS